MGSISDTATPTRFSMAVKTGSQNKKTARYRLQRDEVCV